MRVYTSKLTQYSRIIYFHNLSLVSGGFAPAGFHPWTPLGDFRFQTPNLPTPEKNSAGTHECDVKNQFACLTVKIDAERE